MGRESTRKRYNRTVLPLYVILALALLIVGCATTENGPSVSGRSDTSILWNIDGYPLNVFMGVSAPYSTREQEVAEALYNCARSIAIHNGLEVTSKLVSEASSAGGLLSFATDGSALYEEREVREILERLELVEVRDAGKEGVVIVAKDPTRPALRRPYAQQFDSAKKPTWVTRTPDVPGYLVAVGETLGYRFLRDSLEAADVLAAEALIEKSAEAVTQARSYVWNAQSGNKAHDSAYFREGVLQVASGNLDGFVILARWHDIKTNRFYSLAAVPLA